MLKGCQGLVSGGEKIPVATTLDLSGPVANILPLFKDSWMNKRFSKRCPKCNGNIFFEPDDSIGYKGQPRAWQGWCLQCGYMMYLREARPNTEQKVKV